MNFTRTKVTPAEVHALSEYIGGASQQISGHLTELDGKVKQLQANWDGEAKQAYEIAQKQWNDQVTEMNALLGRVSGKLVEIAQGYDATDRRGAGRFAK
jgi:early secretory antigenic target protein ESAT-6